MNVKLYSKILGNTPKTVYQWKKENRPIIALLESIGEEVLEKFILNPSAGLQIKNIELRDEIRNEIISEQIDFLNSQKK